MKHDTELVYSFQSKIVDYIKENIPWATKIKYFTDGCAGKLIILSRV